MMEWFMAGGFGMFTILAMGVGAIGYGAKVVRDPSEGRLAALRALPALILTDALFSFGTGLWAVNRALESDAFQKAHHVTEGQLPVMGLVGFTEAAQTLTLGALLAMIVVGLRVVAEAKHARR
jgi:hypothetical protein